MQVNKVIESDQEQDSQSSHGNEGSTGSAPKDNTAADEEMQFTQVLQPTMHATEILRTQKKCIQVDLDIVKRMMDAEEFPVNLCMRPLCVPKHVLQLAMKAAAEMTNLADVALDGHAAVRQHFREFRNAFRRQPVRPEQPSQAMLAEVKKLQQQNERLARQNVTLRGEIRELKAKHARGQMEKKMYDSFTGINKEKFILLQAENANLKQLKEHADQNVRSVVEQLTSDNKAATNNVRRFQSLMTNAVTYLKEICRDILYFNVDMPEPLHWNRMDMFLRTNAQPPHLQFWPLRARPVHVNVLVPPVPPPQLPPVPSQNDDDAGDIDEEELE